ncbi:hypothetical protein [Lentzea sp. NPDC060358]|uniref:hypothetical protein n=1 Tax=Lentzea sp. NPDC060358 TaxID=3347103 RepID=UPI00364BBCCB
MVLLTVAILLPLVGDLGDLGESTMAFIGGMWTLLFVIGVAQAWSAKRAHVPPQRTEEAADVLRRLKNDEYCVLLRPFDHEGKTLMPRKRWTGVVARVQTLEQTMAKAVTATFGIPTYAIVDQRIKSAPPGPTYLRAAHDEWQSVALKLLGGAKVIMVLLPEGPDDPEIREGFAWEVEQIADWGLQARVLMVLPPQRKGYGVVHEQACQVLATLEGQPNPLVVDHYQQVMPRSTVLVKVWQGDGLLTALIRQPVFYHLKSRWARASETTYSKGVAELARASPWP